jgi:hypothetical protein
MKINGRMRLATFRRVALSILSVGALRLQSVSSLALHTEAASEQRKCQFSLNKVMSGLS